MKQQIKTEAAPARVGGEWKYGGSASMEIYEADTGRHIATAMRAMMMDGEAERNGRLIAAAPALVAALRRCERALGGGLTTSKQEAVTQARAALALAGGAA
jgi:hypothetical protein